MNYYERIQKAINYIEENLEEKITIKEVAREAFMSESNFYRMFLAMVGYSVKEYIRLRRIDEATHDLRCEEMRVIDVAVKYAYDSVDAFSRAFKSATGFLPSSFHNSKHEFNFERIDIMEKNFETQNSKHMEEYPDIKVLKNLDPMKVAYYCYYGENPEDHAFGVIKEWLNKNKIDVNKSGCRIFGYNNPNPSSPGQKEYGYEVCITIDDSLVVEDEKVKTKNLDGGLYAVIGIKRSEDIGLEIMKGWQRFNKWMKGSKYVYGGHQWLEEHLGFSEDGEHIGGVDLYMPIAEKKEFNTAKEFENVDSMYVASYTVTGRNAEERARKYFFDWSKKQNLFDDGVKHRFFAYYNFEKIGHKDFFYTINVTVDKEFITKDENVKLDQFQGGYYATIKSKYKYNIQAWGEFMDWVAKNEEYTFGDYWFFEEYLIDEPGIDLDTDMILHMPVKQK
ncbi:effector binding domain-containing protein [Inconstantimicrobium mannanitabidum]|uniref:Uncharacterized protein n=1 Tax=Inconstantimicrobium mannanitabidum TaxID=1604901 RepID=A0ACB5RJ43_9CLOT|nr:effector binding domain-containing protein [Clostridium sp. TW13]GKX68860.1 hypothetical protein rsdtw13_41180 [Clostridium sp. TW13]